MTNEHDVRRRLELTAQTIAPRPPASAPAIERQARALRARRRRGVAAGVAAGGIVAALIGVGAWQAGSGPDSTPSGPSIDQLECPETVTATGPYPNRASGGHAGYTPGDIHLVRADCTTEPIVEGPTVDYYPALSHTKAQVVFVRKLAAGGGTALIALDLSTGDTKRLAYATDTLGDPELSPDDSTVAFWLNDSGHPHIYVVPTDGSREATRITDAEANEIAPAWSPDGTKIAFARTTHTSEQALAVVDLTSATESLLDRVTGGLRHPFWGSDDTLFAIKQSGMNLALTAPGYRIVMLDARTGKILGESETFEGYVQATAIEAGRIRVAIAGFTNKDELLGQSQVLEYDDHFRETGHTQPIVGDLGLTPS